MARREVPALDRFASSGHGDEAVNLDGHADLALMGEQGVALLLGTFAEDPAATVGMEQGIVVHDRVEADDATTELVLLRVDVPPRAKGDVDHELPPIDEYPGLPALRTIVILAWRLDTFNPRDASSSRRRAGRPEQRPAAPTGGARLPAGGARDGAGGGGVRWSRPPARRSCPRAGSCAPKVRLPNEYGLPTRLATAAASPGPYPWAATASSSRSTRCGRSTTIPTGPLAPALFTSLVPGPSCAAAVSTAMAASGR